MFRVTLGLATATFFGLAAASPASAGPCCGSNWGLGWGGGCCNASAVYQQPQYVYQQPQYQYYVQPAAPIVVQAPAQQIIVQQPQPEVIFQQAAVAPVPTYTVNHGPHYAGPEVIGYPRTQYYADQPVRAYPYVNGYHSPNRYYGRPYRAWRHGYRPYRPYGVYKSYRPYRHAAYRAGSRHYKDAMPPKKYWR